MTSMRAEMFRVKTGSTANYRFSPALATAHDPEISLVGGTV